MYRFVTPGFSYLLVDDLNTHEAGALLLEKFTQSTRVVVEGGRSYRVEASPKVLELKPDIMNG